MNSNTPPQLKPRRSAARWLLAGAVILIAPVLIIAVGLVSLFSLDGEARLLRREVMAATDAEWSTQVQLSAGGLTLGAVRAGLGLIQAEHLDDARLALKAVRKASVGVYQSDRRSHALAQPELFARTDQRMKAEGWSRMVGVADGSEAVLIYTSDDAGSGGRMDVCLAVVDGDTLVVVSGNVDAASLADLVSKHAPKAELRSKLKLAGI